MVFLNACIVNQLRENSLKLEVLNNIVKYALIALLCYL